MLQVVHENRLKRLVMAFAGKRKVREIWQGDVRLWPDYSLRANALRLEVPAEGTVEWAYWVHAVDAVTRLGASADCYLKLVVDGRVFYLIDSPDGGEALALDGGAVYYESGAAFPVGELGVEVTVEARVPERIDGYPEERWRYNMALEGNKYDEWVEQSGVPGIPNGSGRSVWQSFLPVIRNTKFCSVTSKGQRNAAVRSWYEVVNLPDEVLVCKELTTHAGGRGDFGEEHSLIEGSSGDDAAGGDPWNYWVNESGNEYHAGAWGYRVTMMYNGGGACQFGLNVVWPRFTRVWNLRVISVN